MLDAHIQAAGVHMALDILDQAEKKTSSARQNCSVLVTTTSLKCYFVSHLLVYASLIILNVSKLMGHALQSTPRAKLSVYKCYHFYQNLGLFRNISVVKSV